MKNKSCPTDWEIQKLGNLGTFFRGKGIAKRETTEQGIPCIRYGEIYTQHHYYIKNFHSFIDESTARKSTKIQKGDILFAGSGETKEEIGKSVAYLHKESAYAGGDIIILRTKDVDSLFLAFTLNNGELARERAKLGQGHSVVHIYPKELKNLRIHLPSLSEQRKITSILSTWDKAIELKEKLIEQKKEQKKGLMQKLLTGEVRLPGFNGEWKEIRLGDYLIKHSEKSQLNNQYPVLTSSRRGIFFQRDYYLGSEVASKDNTGYNVVPYGYFTYRHMSDDLIFKFNINDIIEKGIVSTLYPVFTTKEQLNSHFLLMKLNDGNEFKRFALMQKQGGSRTYMYYSKLEELKLTIPSIEEQNKIAELFSVMNKSIHLLEEDLEYCKSQKKGLMQLLLTGKVRVKV